MIQALNTPCITELALERKNLDWTHIGFAKIATIITILQVEQSRYICYAVL